MRIANPQQVTHWKFYLKDPNDQEVMIPSDGVHTHKDRLLNQVLSYINMYDNVTSNEYSKEQRALAAQAGRDFEGYIGQLIENQMCLRNKWIKCYTDGVGDKIHEAMGKVDGYIEKAPAPVRKVIQKMIASVTPSKTKSFGGCGACGGTRIMSPRGNNLGRAGTLNRFLKGK